MMTRAEINRSLVAGAISPAAAERAVRSLYNAHPAQAAHLVDPLGLTGWTPEPEPTRRTRRTRTTDTTEETTMIAQTHETTLATAPPEQPPPASPPSAMTLAGYVRLLRHKHGLSTAQLAEAASLDQAQLEAVERGERTLIHRTLRALATALDADHALMTSLNTRAAASRAARSPARPPRDQEDSEGAAVVWQDDAYRIRRGGDGEEPLVVERAIVRWERVTPTRNGGLSDVLARLIADLQR